MARIRTIKPETFTDPDLAKRSLGARWLFAGMWTEADDKGRLIDSPKRLAGAIFPHEEKVTAAKVKAWIDELESGEHVLRYRVGNHDLLWLPKFTTHQRISHPTPSKLPPHPADGSGEPPPGSGKPPRNSGTTPEDHATDSGLEVEVGSGSGSSSSRNGKRAVTPVDISQRVRRSIEEEDEFFVEARRQIAVWSKTHEVIDMASVVSKFVRTLHEKFPDGLATVAPVRPLRDFVPDGLERAAETVAAAAVATGREALRGARRGRAS